MERESSLVNWDGAVFRNGQMGFFIWNLGTNGLANDIDTFDLNCWCSGSKVIGNRFLLISKSAKDKAAAYSSKISNI